MQLKWMAIVFVAFFCVGPALAADATKGQLAYEAQCAICHGVEGKGDGVGASMLAEPPRDLGACDRMELFDDEGLAKTIRDGRGEMPPWEMLGEESIADLVAYIRGFCAG